MTHYEAIAELCKAYAQIEAMTLELAEALGEVREGDAGGPRVDLTWSELVDIARRLEEDAERRFQACAREELPEEMI